MALSNNLGNRLDMFQTEKKWVGNNLLKRLILYPSRVLGED